MARRTKYSEETVAKIEQALRIGATREMAAAHAGIGASTLYAWAAARPEFQERLTRAEQGGAVVSLAQIEQAARSGDWRAAAWKLERRYPDRYGRRDRVDVHMTIQQEVAALVAAGIVEESEKDAVVAEAEAIVRGHR